MQSQSELPDLPALESVETKGLGMLPIVLAYSGFIGMAVFTAVWAYLEYRDFLQPKEIALIAAVVSLFASAVLRTLFGYFRFKTDANGAYAIGPLRRKFIPWLSVRDAHISTRGGISTLVLDSDHGDMRLSPTSLGISGYTSDCLLASARQHLRRFGKADRIELTPSMLTLWQEIPDDVPFEMEWGKRPSSAGKVAAFLGLAHVLGTIAYLIIDAHGRLGGLMMAGTVVVAFAVLVWMMAPEVLRKAHIVRISRDGVDAQLAFGKVYMPWSAVTSATWQRSMLCIESSAPRKEVRVPYEMGSKESEHLVLAVIRYLRTAGVPQAITWPTLISRTPEYLQQPAYTGQARGILLQAFFNSLDEPVRKRLRTLNAMQLIIVIPGILLPMALVFTRVPERCSAWLHGGYDAGTRFFLCAELLLIAVPLTLAAILMSGLTATAIGRRLARPYEAEWDRLQKVGSGGKSTRVLNYVFAGIGLLGVLAVPLFLDCYTKITNAGVVTNSLLEFRERSYGWQDIRGILVDTKQVQERGHLHVRSNYHIEFTDGRRLTFDEGGGLYAGWRKIENAVEFISSKSGKPIQHRSSTQD